MQREPDILSYFQVPLNAQGEIDVENGYETGNVAIFTMPYDACDAIFPLFLAFNDRFGILIDYEETDRIPAADVPEALAMLRASGLRGRGARVLERMLETAAAHHAFVQITPILV